MSLDLALKRREQVEDSRKKPRFCKTCQGRLSAYNEHAHCWGCLTPWSRKHFRETPPMTAKKKQNGPKGATATFPDLKKTCSKGHILQELGLTLYGKCFECQQANKKSGKKYRAPVRYFYLPGLRERMNGMTPEELAEGTGVHRESIRKYTYKGSKAPDRAAKVFAHALGCSVDDLKWGGSNEDDDPCGEGARGEA